MLPRLVKIKKVALDLLFPKWCISCGREGELICSSCIRLLPWIMPPICPLCGEPRINGALCPRCVNWQAKIGGIRAPFRFDGIVRKAVHQLKYRNLRALAIPLAKLLADYIDANPISGEVLVPIPLHKKRIKERGYNQSGLLARELGRIINLPVVDDCLIRIRHTLPQVKTSVVDERRINVADAFDCRDSRLRNKQVILIDDVATSGATLDACAVALKAKGAVSVWGLVLAREI